MQTIGIGSTLALSKSYRRSKLNKSEDFTNSSKLADDRARSVGSVSTTQIVDRQTRSSTCDTQQRRKDEPRVVGRGSMLITPMLNSVTIYDRQPGKNICWDRNGLMRRDHTQVWEDRIKTPNLTSAQKDIVNSNDGESILVYLDRIMKDHQGENLSAFIQTALKHAGESDLMRESTLKKSETIFPRIPSPDISSTAPNTFSTSDQFNKDVRQSSSETRTSSSPDDSLTKIPSRRREHYNQRASLQPIDRAREIEELTDENIIGTRIGGGRSTNNYPQRSHRQNGLKPITSNTEPQQSQLTLPAGLNVNSTFGNPLSISGLNKPDQPVASRNSEPFQSTSDEKLGAGWTNSHNNTKIPTVTKPPVLTTHATEKTSGKPESHRKHSTSNYKASNNNNNSAHVTPHSNVPSNTNITSHNNNVTSSIQGSSRLRKHDEVKYSDPINGAPVSFQSRLAEIASLEAETVRYERMKRTKRKPKPDD